jgi:hypothetical protein
VRNVPTEPAPLHARLTVTSGAKRGEGSILHTNPVLSVERACCSVTGAPLIGIIL